MPNTHPTANRQIETIQRYMACIGAKDIAGAGRHLDPQALLELPYVDGAEPVRGRDAILEFFTAMLPDNVIRMDFTYDAWYPVDDGETLIAEYHSHCPLRSGGAYENRYIAVFRFNGDLIAMHREYLNPTRMNFAG